MGREVGGGLIKKNVFYVEGKKSFTKLFRVSMGWGSGGALAIYIWNI